VSSELALVLARLFGRGGTARRLLYDAGLYDTGRTTRRIAYRAARHGRRHRCARAELARNADAGPTIVASTQ